MQKSNAPTQLTVAFASGSGAGPVNTIPVPASGTTGAASWTTGFTSVNMEPIASGGVAPFGADFNGIFNALSNAQIWQQSGYLFPYSSAFSSAVSGYPAGAALQMASGLGLWINQADSNTTNPDSAASANWIELCANAGGTSIALSGASVTPTKNQLGAPLLTLTGALSAACKLVLPLRQGASWKIINNTTGGQTVTVGGATGSTVTIAVGSTGAQEVFTDGTNYYTTSFNGAGVYLPVNGTAIAATALANARTISAIGAIGWSVNFDGSANVTATATLSTGAVALSNMASFQANSLMGNPTTSSATPSAITLQNGLQFTGTNLGLGSITTTGLACNGVATFASTVNVASVLSANGTLIANSNNAPGNPTTAISVADTSSSRLGIAPNLGSTSWNGISQSGDVGIIYAISGGGAPASGLVIAPWAGGSTLSGLRLDASGNATFNGNVIATGYIQASSNIYTRGGVLAAYTGLAANAPSNIYIGYNNNVTRWGIGQGTAAQFALYTYNTSGSYLGNPFLMDQSGNTTITGIVTASDFRQSSDARLKTSIAPLRRGIDALRRMAPREYLKEGSPELGFLAQEVKAQAPEACGTNKDGFLTVGAMGVLAIVARAVLDLDDRYSTR